MRALIIDFRLSPLKDLGGDGIINVYTKVHERIFVCVYVCSLTDMAQGGLQVGAALINHRDRPSRTTNHFRIKKKKNLFPIQYYIKAADVPPIIDNGYTRHTRIKSTRCSRYVTHR